MTLFLTPCTIAIQMLTTIANAIDRLNETIGRVLGWLTLLMVLVTFAVVILRYGFDWGSIAMQESVNYLHALVFMAGAAYTLKRNEHVRVDIVYTRLSDRGKAWVDLLGTLILLLPFCIFLIWISLPYVRNSWQLLEGSREAGGLPLVYLLKSFIPRGNMSSVHDIAMRCGSNFSTSSRNSLKTSVVFNITSSGVFWFGRT